MPRFSAASSVSDFHIAPRRFPGHFSLPALWLLLLLVLVPVAGAQLYTGSISGTVSDPSGAVIPGATVKAVDQAKGFAFTATSDGAGRYLLRPIPPGRYTIAAESAGFQVLRKENIAISVNDNATIDFALQVGKTSEVVEVQSAGVQLQTQDAVTGQVVNRQFINNLPLVSRDFYDLALLAPGTATPDNQCEGCTATNFVSNGGRNSTADVLVDGVSISNFEQNSGVMSATYTPSVESVEEFKVQQSNFSAEFGFSGSTIVNVVTRSGTNQFHGSLYEFLRNDKLDANNWFSNHNGEARAPMKRNNFGLTIGGPIVKNKTFFFFDYDGTRERSFAAANAGVPSAAEKTGDFGELCGLQGGNFDGSGRCDVADGQLWDPYDPNAYFDSGQGGPVRTAFIPYNNIAAYASQGTANPGVAGNLIDPVALQMMAYFPDATQEVATADDRFNNWFRSGTNRSSDNKFDIKIDHRFSDKSLLSAKYSQESSNSHSFNCFGNEADNCSGGPVDSTRHLFALNESYTFSPTVVLNVSYGYSRGFDFQKGIHGDYPDLNPVTQLGMPSYILTSGFPVFPNIILDGYAAPADANIGTQTFTYLKEGQDTHHLTGALSWTRGSHDLKFGAEGRMHRINFGQPGWPGGQYEFDPSGTAEAPGAGNGGDSMASFLMGVGPSVGCGWCPYEVPNFVSTQNFQWGAFVQDNWRVTPKLTLNLGVRWDISVPRTERYNRQNYLDLKAVNPINGGSVTYEDPLTAEMVTRTLYGAEVFNSSKNRYNFGLDWNDIQPRFGFAYQTPHDFVVRGGYGIFYSTPRSGAAGTGPINNYKGYDQITQWVTVNPSNQVTPYATLSNPFPNGGPLLPPGNSLGALNDVGFDGGGNIKSLTNTPYEQSWSFGFEKLLPGKVLLDTSYVGKKGTHLYFSGANELNHLGIGIESLSPSQISDLLNTVPNPFYGVITDPNSVLSYPEIQAFQLLRPYPQYTSLGGDAFPYASSIYHALQVRVEKQYANGLQFLATYTWSKSIDDSSSTDDSVVWLGGFTSLQDPNRRYLERSVSTWDIPHLLQLSYVYDLPFGRGRHFGGNMNSVLNGFLGGWQLNGTFRFSSGRPILLTLQDGVVQAIPTYGIPRPNLTGKLRRNNGSDFVDSYFANPDVLSKPDDFTLGNAPRATTSARQPGMNNATMSLFKQFSLASVREGMRMEFRVETFNTFNHPQFCGPNTTANFDSEGNVSGDFGAVTGTCVAAREAQMALKLYW
ncbi:MAG: TonB-dependent receptor [Acidobacteria bacterium]|nr:TonB-dependent receptor [Acidobacteriota bacterium]